MMRVQAFFRKTIFLVCLAAMSLSARAEDGESGRWTLYYYGVVTNVNDQNMLNITQDLFFAQLRGIDYIDIIDNRAAPVKEGYSEISADADGSAFARSLASEPGAASGSLVFWTRIFRPRSDEKWECSFYTENTDSGKIFSQSKKYDSYYKILTDAKFIIQSLVSEAVGNIESGTALEQKIPSPPKQSAAVSSEIVAGTWGGESNISKIILMRSGRGFIIFTNGATMNISVLAGEQGTIKIVQQDKFNASYYPDIDRQTILGYAQSAAPIEWNLTLTDAGTLSGTKKTLVAKNGAVEPSSQSVTWTKK